MQYAIKEPTLKKKVSIDLKATKNPAPKKKVSIDLKATRTLAPPLSNRGRALSKLKKKFTTAERTLAPPLSMRGRAYNAIVKRPIKKVKNTLGFSKGGGVAVQGTKFKGTF